MIVKSPLATFRKGVAHCKVCARRCTIPDGQTGFCGIRKNAGGKLDLLVYGRPSALGIDPVEKKPQYHFLPGTTAYSLGTYGCTFMCRFCCNWELAQAIREHLPLDTWYDLPPEKAVAEAQAHGCASMAYTYNEPAIWYEYHRDIGMLARKKGLYNILVTDGYGTKEFWGKAAKYIDAASVDFKGFSRKFYAEYTGAMLDPVVESLSHSVKHKIWTEITMLVIPGHNDAEGDMLAAFEHFASVGEDIPLHLIGFHPSYKMLEVPRTSASQLIRLRELALRKGLRYVYIGNVPTEFNNTVCPDCGALLVDRSGYIGVMTGDLSPEKSKCLKCGCKIPGVWAVKGKR